jgi:hypothetical protein
LAARVEEESDVPVVKLPDTEALRGALERRAAKDRDHQAQIDAVAARVSLQCTYCHAGMARKETTFCASCLAPHHEDCFREHGRCAAPGCGEQVAVHPGGREGGASAPAWRRPGRGRQLVAGLLLGGVAAFAFTGVLYDVFMVPREESRVLEAAEREARLRAALKELDAMRAAGVNPEGLREKAREIDDLRERLVESEDSTLDLARRYDQEKKRLQDEREALQAELARVRQEQELLRQQLWEKLQGELAAKGLSSADMASLRAELFGPDGPSEDAMEREIEALFAQIEELSAKRDVEALITKFSQLRALIRRHGESGSEAVKARMAKAQQRLAQFGEVSLSIQLQVYINEGNQSLRSLAHFAQDKDSVALKHHLEKLHRVCADMGAEEREVFHRNAKSLWERGLARAKSGGALEVTLTGVDAVGARAEDGRFFPLAEPLQGDGWRKAFGQPIGAPGPSLLLFEGGSPSNPVIAIVPVAGPSPAADAAGQAESPGPELGEPSEKRFGRIERMQGRPLLVTVAGSAYPFGEGVYAAHRNLLVTLKRGERVRVYLKVGVVQRIERAPNK